MRADRPKQYLPLLGKPVLWHSLQRLAVVPEIRGIVVGLSREDRLWSEIPPVDKVVATSNGGAERADTVIAALDELRRHAGLDDWVLVHDAARPCVHPDDVRNLLISVEGHADGGLLAVPISDTVKRATREGRVESTLDRTGLWRAATPQLFPIGALYQALGNARKSGTEVTDESSAMERSGAHPRLVCGRSDNIKITVPEDLELAEMILRSQSQERP